MYLTDTDIFNWNDRISLKNVFISARYSNMSSYPNIVFLKKENNIIEDSSKYQNDPKVKYKFTFSISNNRESEFNNIVQKLIDEKYQNYLEINDSLITADPKVIETIKKTKHNIHNTEYLRLEYLFNGNLSSIIAYVHILESAIKWFSQIWGYDEDGNEYRLIKFSVGDIVSPISDRSKDLLISDLDYNRFGNSYTIKYNTSEIISNNSQISYGKQCKYNEDDLTYSRNDRINKILN
jgi:hypothetical protein